MSVLSSERAHYQGVEHSVANNRWNDAAALQATQTIDNASNGRQCQINSGASVSACKYGRHEGMTKVSNALFERNFRPTKGKPL